MFKHTPQQARKMWVDALRSGRYNQTRHILCRILDREKYFCVFGVAVLLFEANEYPCPDNSNWSPGPTVKRWLGITLSQADNIMMLNDQERLTFNELANTIEKLLFLYQE